MSNAIRTYARKAVARRSRRRSSGLGCIVPFLLILLVAAGWALWVTRDSHPSTRFIAADRSYEIYASNFLQKRARLSEAALWRLLPESAPLASDFAVLSQKLDMPGWVLNHIAYSTFHVSGHDLEGFSDPLLISRMSRIGCLIERFNRFSSDVGYDHAGGLELRSVDAGALFYAVRGRILLVSPNRSALIRALTLSPAESAPVTEGAEAPVTATAPDVRVRIQPADGSLLAGVFEHAEIGFSASGTEARFECRVTLEPEHAARFAPLLAEAKPVPLLVPAPGLLEISADFGRKLPATWRGIDSAMAESTWFPLLLEDLQRFAGDRQDALHDVFAPLFAGAGPGLTVTWHGFDQEAMLPAPQFTLSAPHPAQQFETQLAELPEIPETGHQWSLPAYRVPGEARVIVPLHGGPAMTPTVTQAGDLLIAGLGEDTVRDTAASTNKTFLEGPANLRIAFAPKTLLGPLRDTALSLAGEGLLRDTAPEAVRAGWAPWIALASEISAVELRAAHEDGALNVVLSLDLVESATE